MIGVGSGSVSSGMRESKTEIVVCCTSPQYFEVAFVFPQYCTK